MRAGRGSGAVEGRTTSAHPQRDFRATPSRGGKGGRGTAPAPPLRKIIILFFKDEPWGAGRAGEVEGVGVGCEGWLSAQVPAPGGEASLLIPSLLFGGEKNNNNKKRSRVVWEGGEWCAGPCVLCCAAITHPRTIPPARPPSSYQTVK